jgi:hypothetical protein
MMDALSQSTRALFKAARTDGPSAVARTKIWSGVAGATSIGAGAAIGSAANASAGAASASSAGAGAGAGKLLLAGTLFGGALTVGVAALVLRMGSPSVLPQEPASAAPTVASSFVSVASAAADSEDTTADSEENSIYLASRAREDGFMAPQSPPGPRADLSAVNEPPAAQVPQAPHVADALTREAMLIAQARGALRTGDAVGALSAARSAKRIPGAQLEPEALAVEIGALRALGREADAVAAELELRRKYPEHALARH